MAPRGSWGIYPAAAPQLTIRAWNDPRSLRPCLQLLVWKIGDWPVKMLGTQTSFCVGWITSFLLSFANQLPMECELKSDLPPSSSSEEEAPLARRERGLTRKEPPQLFE